MTLEDAGIDLIGLPEFSFNQSSLFNGSQDKTKETSGPFYADEDAEDPNLKQKEKRQDVDSINESTLDDTKNGCTKEFRLSNGELKSMKLKIRRNERSDRRLIIEEDLNDIVNIEGLFQKVEEKKVMKENNSKLRSREATKHVSNSNDIWTEKYRPNNFLSLCSAGNDRQYRLILHWLKKWSHTVYGEQMEKDFVDYLGRPLKKILLVSGPSGIGKTSAVQVLARQMGYHIEEINAANSNDTMFSTVGNDYIQNRQSVTNTLRLKIKNALSMNTLTSSNKPTCLMIDEIDSSSNANDIIRILGDLVSSDSRAVSKVSKNNAESESKKGKKKDFILNRPIICIANELYTSGRGSVSMEKLRPFCEIVSFKKPYNPKNISGLSKGGNALRTVKEHLMRISEKEKLDMDFQDIGEVVEICDGDLRACLNYLQFNGRKSSYLFDGGSQKRRKDGQISWFSFIDVLFRRNQSLSKDENFQCLMKDLTEGYGKSIITNNSLFEKVIRGAFNKYLDSVYHSDDSLAKPCEFSDWLCFYDITTRNSSISDTENLNISIGLKIWSLFSEINPDRNKDLKPLIDNAKGIEYESFETRKQNKDIMRRLDRNIPINTRISLDLSEENLACYVVPSLSKMISPNLSSNKVKASQTQFDKTLLKRVAKLINEFNIEMHSGTDYDTNQPYYYFVPDFDAIIQYNTDFSYSPQRILDKQTQQSRSWLFPLLQSEIERLKFTREAPKRPLEIKGKESTPENTKKYKSASSVDFFKGKYDGLATQISESSSEKKKNSTKTRIWVKYNEGFSNAVRKNIGWNDLWIP